MRRVALWAIGSDRPGIVAAVTGVIVERGGSLADCSMTILDGQFAMVLLIDAPDALALEALEGDLGEVAARLELLITTREITAESQPIRGDRFECSVYGADRPGIVHEIATVLAAADANITDLATRVIGDERAPVYAMLIDFTMPGGSSDAHVEALRVALAARADDLGVEATLNRSDADVF